MFYDPSQFRFVRHLEASWKLIFREFQEVRNDLQPWIEPELYDNNWDVYRIFDFPHGLPIQPHIQRCPQTANVVRQCFPKHGVAGFSVLGPRTAIHPHVGYQGPYLRCHLALSVPEGDCQLSIGDEQRKWETGKALVFDDRVTHAAWNRTGQSRVVLLVDFVPEQVNSR